MKPYLFICKTRIQKSLAYQFNLFANILFQCIVMFAMTFFWKALFREKEFVQGVGLDDMLIYTVISTIMYILLSVNVEDRVIDSVRQGTVATDMLKPISLFGTYFAEDLGHSIMLIFQNVIPILLIACLFIKVPAPVNGIHFLLFLGSFLLSYLINWLFSAIFSMWAFTAISIQPMVQAKKHIVRLLSGSMIPIWFFPVIFEKVLGILPFYYMYQLPLNIYIGKGTQSETAVGFLIQLSWLLILFLIFRLLEHRVLSKVMVQGG